ncbi:MAG: hypothetical protein WD276_05895 [Actinomycetota bacterium]
MEPEHELIRRVLPFSLPVAVLAFVFGTVLADADAGWSAAAGVAIVFANFAAHGLSLAWAARISPTVVFAVGMGGFVLRLGIFAAIMVLLRRFEWFSTVAFIGALVPVTIALLVMEMKLLSGRMRVDLWAIPPGQRQGAP